MAHIQRLDEVIRAEIQVLKREELARQRRKVLEALRYLGCTDPPN